MVSRNAPIPLQFFVAPMPLLIHITLIHITGAC